MPHGHPVGTAQRPKRGFPEGGGTADQAHCGLATVRSSGATRAGRGLNFGAQVPKRIHGPVGHNRSAHSRGLPMSWSRLQVCAAVNKGESMNAAPASQAGYVSAAVPVNESERLTALQSYGLLDSDPEQAFDDVAEVASLLCGTPIALVSLVGDARQWFKSKLGLDASETPRDVSFCAHAILNPEEVFVVGDTHDDHRFALNPLVTGEPKIRFYAGAPLVSSEGQALGTLCVIDRVPRLLGPRELGGLKALARQVVTQLELRRSVVDAMASAQLDPPTGASNRLAFGAQLMHEWNTLSRAGRPLAMLIVDVDDFKRCRDELGEAAADTVLQQVVKIAESVLRPSDRLVRWGGAALRVLLPDTDDVGALHVAEQLRTGVEQATWPGGLVSVSIGASSVLPDGGTSPYELLTRCDRALSAAQSGGRNRSQLFVGPHW